MINVLSYPINKYLTASHCKNICNSVDYKNDDRKPAI